MKQEYNFIVRVSCLTYNHAPYIIDAMNGFTMQETTFPFVCTIIDDASTDGEQEVIKEYLQDNFDLGDKSVVRNEETDDYVLTFARHKTNQNCYFVVIYLKYNHRSIRKSKNPYIQDWIDTKYIAFCEGDDYWIDPYKLQKQLDVMEASPLYSMCFHAINKLRDGVVVGHDVHYRKEIDVSAERIISYGGSFCATASIFVKSNIYKEMPLFRKIANVGDYPLQVLAAYRGKIHYMPQIMGCYRVHSTSWTAKNKPESNINHQENRIKWLEEYNRFTHFKYNSAVFYAIMDSAMVLYNEKFISKSQIIHIFKNIKIIHLDIDFNHKMIFFKHYLYVISPTIYHYLKKCIK